MFGKKKKQTQDDALFHCSFCHKSQRDVRRLIQGPKVLICDECVKICWDIVSDLYAPDEEIVSGDVPGQEHAAQSTSIVGLCAICRLPAGMSEALALPDRGIICPGCRGAIEAAIAAGETDRAE